MRNNFVLAMTALFWDASFDVKQFCINRFRLFFFNFRLTLSKIASGFWIDYCFFPPGQPWRWSDSGRPAARGSLLIVCRCCLMGVAALCADWFCCPVGFVVLVESVVLIGFLVLADSDVWWIWQFPLRLSSWWISHNFLTDSVVRWLSWCPIDSVVWQVS